MVTRTPTVSEPGRLGLLVAALAVSAGALTIEAGPLGAAVAVFGVAVAIATTGVVGVAVLHLGVLALVNAPTVVGLVLLETASGFLLVADVPVGRRLETGALFVPIAVALTVAVTSLAERDGLVSGAFTLVVVVAIGTYLLHRYARVRLGLAAGELET